jgi:hypothetical protein
MANIEVTPDDLDRVALQVKRMTSDVDGARIDLSMRLLGIGPALGKTGSRRPAEDFARLSDAFLVATRDELAAMSEFLNQTAAAYRAADDALGAGASR